MDMLECHPMASSQESLPLSCFFGAFLPHWGFLITSHDISHPPLNFYCIYFLKKVYFIFSCVYMGTRM